MSIKLFLFQQLLAKGVFILRCFAGDVNEAIDLYKEALRRLKVSDYIAIDDPIMEKMRVDLAELLHAVGR